MGMLVYMLEISNKAGLVIKTYANYIQILMYLRCSFFYIKHMW
jgi:hypothetical protein